MRVRLAVLAVAGLLAMLGVTAITASGTGHETEVRITAALAVDGRIEFALQQREADGGWGERLLPRARFFPATIAAGRWLVSTPLTVRAPGAGDDAESAEVRITAQRLADGRTEFALQEREADGEWGERLLPRARFFPATVTVGRWLVSTPLTVSLPEPTATATPTPTPTSRDEFNSHTPAGYTGVDLRDSGRVWGRPERFTSDSSVGTVAYMLLGTLAGCNFADAEADRSSKVYIKTQSLGRLTGYESVSVCRLTSSSWSFWSGVRVTHLRFFDESSPSNVREYVYDDATGSYVETTPSTTDPTPVPTPTSTTTPPPEPTATATPTPTPTSTATSSSARDRDGDGLIEVDNLTQLDAIRWDTDGDGISDNADYAAAFSDAGTGTLCSVASCAGYELTANLDFDTNGNGEADEGDVYWNSGRGWIPIGESSAFDSTFEGGGHTISNLHIRRSPTVGLFGVLGSGSTVSGIGLVDASVGASGYGAAGALAGIAHGVIEDSFADGLVAGCVDNIGGLVGVNHGSIANSHSAVDVINAGKSHRAAFVVITDLFSDLIDIPLFISSRLACSGSVGGLVGDNEGTIASSHSTSVVSGLTDNFGGLAGENSGTITDSYATGSVSGKGFADLGGLVGENETEGKILSSYATGAVSGQGDNFGGLTGVNSGAITDSYATGNVSGSGFADVGGLVGDNRNTGVITAAYAQGSVSGRADRYGGLIGSNQGVVTVCFSTGAVPRNGGGLIDSNGNNGTVANCYWDTETSGQANSDGGTGKTSQELQSPTGYTGIYAAWNVDLDGDGTVDDPWGFGTPTQYPTLKGGGTAPDPDLVVDTLTLSGPPAGVSFTLSARVRNQGAVASGTTTLRYYHSTDSKITTSDTQVGTDSVSGLAAFGASAQSIGVTVTAPDIPGTYYYYGACVDADSDETITTNNCSSSVKIAVGVVPGNPPNQRYSRQDATTIVTWDPSAGATHYKVYYDDFFSTSCPGACGLLAGNVTGTTYTHASPDERRNYYWVVGCNSAGCSDPDGGNPAQFVDNRPAAPTNAQYVRAGSTTVVSWGASPGTDYYRVYYHNFFSTSCPGFCELLAGNVTGTTYTHASPDEGRNYYWVVACNGAGCSDPDGGNPAQFVDNRPAAPTNAQYVRVGSTEVVSWGASPGTDYYRVYYHDFLSRSCFLTSGSPSFCELLAGNVTGTTYTHASPDANRNYYWVVGCNSAGCSDIDRRNPATLATEPSTGTTSTQTPSTSTTSTSGDCQVGVVVSPGESCIYPGTSTEFSVDSAGSGHFLVFTGNSISLQDVTVNGVPYDFEASRQADGTWLITAIGS